MSKSIFISHAVKDKAFVNEFVNYLRLAANLTTDDIFCCSFEEMGIQAGKYFVDFVKTELKSSKVVISIISPNYLDSEFSLCELGATWLIEDIKFYPILLPPLDYDDQDGILKGLQTIKIGRDKKLSTMIQEITEICETSFKVANCQTKTEDFISQLPTLLKTIPEPNTCKKEELDEIKKELDSFKAEYRELESENVRLNKIIEELKNLKDKAEFDKVLLQDSPLEERFEMIVDNLNSTLSDNSMMINYLLFKDYQSADGISSKHLRDFEIYERELRNDVENDLVYFDEDESTYYLNKSDYSIKKSLEALKTFNDSLGEFDSVELEQLNDYYKINIKLDNKRFWEDILKIHLPSFTC